MNAQAASRTFETRIAVDDREPLVALLNQLLANLLDLTSQAKYAHWNVKGHHFYQFHLLFDEIAGRLSAMSDEVAERAVTLGGVAQGTLRQGAQASQIGEYDLNAVDGKEHVGALSFQLAKVAAVLRQGIEEAEKGKDPATVDLLTEMSGKIEKDLWFLEAHLQK